MGGVGTPQGRLSPFPAAPATPSSLHFATPLGSVSTSPTASLCRLTTLCILVPCPCFSALVRALQHRICGGRSPRALFASVSTGLRVVVTYFSTWLPASPSRNVRVHCPVSECALPLWGRLIRTIGYVLSSHPLGPIRRLSVQRVLPVRLALTQGPSHPRASQICFSQISPPVSQRPSRRRIPDVPPHLV